MAARSLLIVDRFAPEGRALRAAFDQRFEDPRRAEAGRFVWDYWHVPGQYTALRTPAWQYFPRAAYQKFHQRLAWWGRRVLGCHDVSPPWLSCYVSGCEQRLHGDLPHGHWAFVYSLTNWDRRKFTGGETLLLRDEVLDWWGGFQSSRGVEEPELIEEVPARFNRLVVFDPRRPHGVRRVDGVHDPREGRLVIHGWFVQPRPFIEGPLTPRALQSGIDELTEWLGAELEELSIAGLLSLRFSVNAAGHASKVTLLSDTTRVAPVDEPRRRALLKKLIARVSELRFGKARGASHVTLPLVFEAMPEA
ncbi:MAG: hypothetical protein QM723_09930 [Myxococcaceae bacterium]